MSKVLIYGSSAGLAIFILTLALSTYGIGREEHDKSSSNYQAASVFATVAATGTVITMLLLFIGALAGAPAPKVSAQTVPVQLAS